MSVEWRLIGIRPGISAAALVSLIGRWYKARLVFGLGRSRRVKLGTCYVESLSSYRQTSGYR
jgi:hypothetical protein